MRFTKLSLFTAGAVVILILAVPRAAHAVVATLVQVSNTVAAPAITQSVAEQAQQLLQVECSYDLLVRQTSCNFIAPTGLLNGPSSAVTISPSQNFVITGVDIQQPVEGQAQTTCGSDAGIGLTINSPVVGQTTRASWMVAGHSGSQHFAYPSGILIAGGTEFVGLSVNSSTNDCVIIVDVFGYLTTL
jgi:hypothetical protein